MLSIELIHTLIHSFATLCALALAIHAYRIARRNTPRTLRRQIDDLQAEHDRLAAWYVKLNANVASIRAEQKRKGERVDEPDDGPALATKQRPGETPQQWKERMRLQIATGGLQHK